ncbi:hypothetical protein P7K49_010896 [Saguinus oedipus]|uniref:Uncharacterized protein n=1 Tax=Saguinus oedipus TaxID=9490 RepID=A0ABQ9VPV5_SAGOE|nr:hypothetical protein P7K49_010896 [Saguinus oedipus]
MRMRHTPIHLLLEGDRRQNLLDDLVTRERLLLASFKNEGAEPDLIRGKGVAQLNPSPHSSPVSESHFKEPTAALNPALLEDPENGRNESCGVEKVEMDSNGLIQMTWSLTKSEKPTCD